MAIRIILILFIGIISSCQLFDQPEKIPSFVHIEDISFSISNSLQGTQSEKITDAWVYVDGNFEGIYELPSTLPLHYEGNHEITIYPGIKKNGISADREKYPFYTSFAQNINLTPDSIIEIFPEVYYEDDLFIWIEDFEDPQGRFSPFINSDADITIINSPSNEVFEGKSGAINMNASNYYCELRTDVLDFNNFPKNLNIPAYIEMNYSCNFPFAVGVLHKDASISAYQKQPIITLFPTSTDSLDTWNKTYLFISDATNFYTSATEFDLYIAVSNSQGNDNVKIRLDNIKVIYRQ
jgi:hypothetical protein